MTHEQYLDEPGDVIEWTLRIGKLKAELENERKREAQRAGG